MTITVIGHGYVGLVTACVFADFGNDVWVIGHTKEKINRLKKGDPIIFEPGLSELLQKNLKAKRIHFTLDYQDAIPHSEVVFIAVGTPPKTNGEADLSAIYTVARNLAYNIKKPLVVACKSTVPVGTNQKIAIIINRYKRTQARIFTASCPEFLREGSAIYDTLHPDRIVIGADSKKSIDILIKLHQPLNGKRIITDIASAELIKYTANAMLATKISFANLISFYCEKTGADVETVLDAVGLDQRIGRVYMNPGIGFGGSCLPKDISALIQIGKQLKIDVGFLKAVENINNHAAENFIDKITKTVTDGKIGVWGISFKPNTDDIRDSPSIKIILRLIQLGYIITAYDPAAINNAKKSIKIIKYVNDPYLAIKSAKALVIMTEWNEFKQIDWKKVKQLMQQPLIFDGRNLYQPATMKQLKFRYFSIGRKPI